ncbi:hypothetical protein FOZ63_017084 [Perkinsus olseni]|uniref:Uncharacterized protein n=1 Tax=Perkinsus olseni TaxID=32597 RepID=A0A7J6QL65_PEROL|nr:hypothetical protein FOZ63_017084 [Perkinsus olseni]
MQQASQTKREESETHNKEHQSPMPLEGLIPQFLEKAHLLIWLLDLYIGDIVQTSHFIFVGLLDCALYWGIADVEVAHEDEERHG